MENIKKVEYYVFPGGRVEEGENLVACITRELMKELGIQVNIIKTVYRIENEKDI